MKNEIVSDGAERLCDGRKAKYLETGLAKYADEWAEAGFLKRIWRGWLIWRNGQNGQDEKQSGHKPSPGTLW
jgi:hypothetical protein